jgi:hypothetical protein
VRDGAGGRRFAPSALRLLSLRAVLFGLRRYGRLGFGRGTRGRRRLRGPGNGLALLPGARRAAVELPIQRPAEIRPRLLAVRVGAATLHRAGEARQRLLAVRVAAAAQLHARDTRKRLLAVRIRATAGGRVASRARLPILGPLRPALASNRRSADPTQGQDRRQTSRSGHGLHPFTTIRKSVLSEVFGHLRPRQRPGLPFAA